MPRDVVFAHEASERVRIAFLGTSGHAFRNYLPVLPFLPVEYVAQWDHNKERALAFARQFGAREAGYDDLHQLLRDHQPTAVWIATDERHADGRSIQPDLIAQALEAGCHVFCDKPVASSAEEVRELIRRRDRAGKVVSVGIKTMHYPTYGRVRALIDDPASGFGSLKSLTVRYPQHTPPQGGTDFNDPVRRTALGHVWHPIGAALRIGGPLRTVHLLHDPEGRNGIVTATFRSGAIASFHFPVTRSPVSPLEYLEAVGEGSNAVVDNAMRLTYFRATPRGTYGRATDSLTSLDDAPLRWEPEFSLGTLANDHNFIQGYAQSLLHFTDAVMTGQQSTVGTLEDALEVMKVHEALCDGPGTTREIAAG